MTVVAPDAESADALSTAFAVSPPEMVGDLAGTLDGVAVVAVSRGGRARVFGRRPLAMRRVRA